MDSENNDLLIPKQYESNIGYKITIISIVLLTVFLLFLGINIFYIIINLLIITGDLFVKSLGTIGYVSGNAVNDTTTTIANSTISGIDITAGAIHTAGNLVKSVSKPFVDDETSKNIDTSSSSITKVNPIVISSPSTAPSNKKESFSLFNNNFEPNFTINPIQNSANSKEKWCLVGEPDGIRSCISVNDYDKCASSQIYPSQKECMNPILMAK